ncbi:trypsin-like peptidase domain-containing protein [Vibrio parahaemolyticus]|uniref:trypsin-like peptidase domain-containing protein n=1 Tax=Vibrio parahaemolyticus TaxID=670 RepID=UPI00221E4177|nr:trypsin-like peptidase domain-containing protein [Vibrio parahaemolyticus]EJG1724200.1 trypsin-like peptidase domain-containing protein [Vibrio parahaemolyticus]EJG1737690.1 trypsin-like peptidase domain-containing protein [Vibrio parahaemolyticus]EJG1752341.1 trypsin-like peptidase domain-containing protein [Vibrio parahaemolyticus]EJG1756114.1 trypsin-like peptidase domain-containing protein [Vibrio parahaemolyticus]UYW14401.1 trypsin-like peptidase domain-containing protein [Vibrio parah
MFGTPNGLHECMTVSDLYRFLGYDEKNTGGFLYGSAIKYRAFSVAKKGGGERKIYSPIKKLKNLQHIVKSELESYYVPRQCVHGFVSGKNIISNAQPHVRKEYVLNIDLEDFFGSINFGRVRKLFQSSPLSLPPSVASVLAHICCYRGALPQGAPTSPIVSNMIAFRLDRQLRELAYKNSCSYTRYADDISFSFTNRKKSLPKAIAFFNGEDELVLGKDLKDIIENNWFKVNDKKTRIQHRTQRQSVTNITVNEKVNVNRKFIRQTSSMLHAIIKYGAVKAEQEYFEKYHKGYIANKHQAKMREEPGKLFVQKVRGRLNYIGSVRGNSCDVWRKLMYKYTLAIGSPNEAYNRSWWEIAEESTYILYDLSEVGKGQGSGFLLEGIGLITNEHVVTGVEQSNIVDSLVIEWLPNQSKQFIDLNVAWKDVDKDLAVITSDSIFNDTEPLKVEPNPNYSRGTEVYAIGYPAYESRGDKSATTLKAKITGATKREGQDRIVIDKPIIHGHSGGAVLNSDGRVIGIVANGNAEGAIKATPSAFIPISTLLDEHDIRMKAQSTQT